MSRDICDQYMMVSRWCFERKKTCESVLFWETDQSFWKSFDSLDTNSWFIKKYLINFIVKYWAFDDISPKITIKIKINDSIWKCSEHHLVKMLQEFLKLSIILLITLQKTAHDVTTCRFQKVSQDGFNKRAK